MKGDLRSSRALRDAELRDGDRKCSRDTGNKMAAPFYATCLFPLCTTFLPTYHLPTYLPTYASLCNPPKEREFVTAELTLHCAASRSSRSNIETFVALGVYAPTIRQLLFARDTALTKYYDISFLPFTSRAVFYRAPEIIRKRFY